MQTLTVDQAQRQLASREPPMLSQEGLPIHTSPELHTLQFSFADELPGRLHYLSERIVAALEHWEWCALWITLWGVWSSSENMHLYYRLRQSYGDLRHLTDAPVHLALRHESFDVSTLLQVVMMNGWDAYLLTSHDYARAFVSHDGYCQLSLPAHENVAVRRDELSSWKVDAKVVATAA